MVLCFILLSAFILNLKKLTFIFFIDLFDFKYSKLRYSLIYIFPLCVLYPIIFALKYLNL